MFGISTLDIAIIVAGLLIGLGLTLIAESIRQLAWIVEKMKDK